MRFISIALLFSFSFASAEPGGSGSNYSGAYRSSNTSLSPVEACAKKGGKMVSGDFGEVDFCQSGLTDYNANSSDKFDEEIVSKDQLRGGTNPTEGCNYGYNSKEE